jgi:hypothetical protein
VQVTSSDVTGVYNGTRCFRTASFESCIPGITLVYRCDLQSQVGPEKVCSWRTSVFFESFPNVLHISACIIETDGTAAGGAFTGRITWCSGPMNDYLSSMRFTGSVEDGTLTATAVSFIAGVGEAQETFEGTLTDPVP